MPNPNDGGHDPVMYIVELPETPETNIHVNNLSGAEIVAAIEKLFVEALKVVASGELTEITLARKCACGDCRSLAHYTVDAAQLDMMYKESDCATFKDFLATLAKKMVTSLNNDMANKAKLEALFGALSLLFGDDEDEDS